jgi:hypothetical protein
VHPGSADDFETADTTGYSTWESIYNDDNTWDLGAFSKVDNEVDFDYGWGQYNLATHQVLGIRFFIARVGDVYKKIYIQSLVSSVFTITIANLDNTEKQVLTFNKSTEVAGKNFGYINILTGEILDREPNNTEWDLVFQRYSALQYNDTYATATGIRQNRNVTAAKVYPIDDVENFKDTAGVEFQSEINTIGYGWKAIDYNTFQWTILDSTVYFVKDVNKEYWKIVFRDFGGSATGNYSFSKEKLVVSTGIINRKNPISISMSLYPNPSANGQFTVAYDIQKSVSRLSLDILDLSGRVVYHQQLSPSAGFSTQSISVPQLSSGLYLVRVSQDGNGVTQKISIQ